MSEESKAKRYLTARLSGKSDAEANAIAGYRGTTPGYVINAYVAELKRRMLAARTTSNPGKR